MSKFDAAAGESSATDGCTDLKQRDVRALTEYMTTLPLGGNVYSVTTQSGSEYRVDAVQGRCTCPDKQYNLEDGELCKHERRVRFATGQWAIPAWVDADEVDAQLGEHVEKSLQMAATDGGEVISGHSDKKNEAEYTYHVEPPEQGGARYVRCEGCGREVIPADPDLIQHPSACPNSE